METYDWAVIERTFRYVPAMRACIQDPVYHAEGDAWTHTKMVMNALEQQGNDDHTLRLTTLFHDTAKPETRTVTFDPERDREVISHPSHSRIGATNAWYDLWLADEPLERRLAVYWLCRWHQTVFHMWDSRDMMRDALTFACVGDWAQLLAFARADNAGRICATSQRGADNLALLHDWLAEAGADRSRSIGQFWDNDHDRLFYLEKTHRSPWYRAQEPRGSRVIVLSGLPGVGKNHHCATVLGDLPMVSPDTIRAKLDIDPTDNQGQVVQAALEEARVFLRQRKPFIWNGQCVTRLARDKIISLCRDYDAHVSIHAFDRPLRTILAQNKQRDRHAEVPEKVILAAARKWEPPSKLEAHSVEWV